MGVGALNVGVLANTARANKNLKSFRAEIGKSAKATSLASKSFKALGTSLAAYASISAAKGAFRSFRTMAEDLTEAQRASKRLGIGVQALQRLEYAAQQSGIEVELLRDGLQEMQLRSSEAARGSGAAAEAFQQLGIDAKKFNDLAPDRKLNKIADAMRGVRNSADRISLSDQLFGGEATKFISILDQGSAGIKRFGDEADRLGLTTSRNLDDVAKFTKAMDRLDRSFSRVGRELTISIAPSAIAFANQLSLAAETLADVDKKGDANTLYSWVTSVRDSFAKAIAGDIGRQFNQAFSNPKGIPKTESLTTSVSKIADERKRTSSPGKSARAFEQKRAILGGFREVGRELGRLSNDATAGRVLGAKASPRMIDEAPRGLNALIDANSREGYMALRANMRGGETVKHARETAAATKGADAKLSTLVSLTNRLLSFYENAPPPRGI